MLAYYSSGMIGISVRIYTYTCSYICMAERERYIYIYVDTGMHIYTVYM